MSIYATWLMLGGENHDVERCAAYFEESPGCWDFTGKACDCDAWQERPLVYEGSHHLPSDSDPRGGLLEVGAIPDHVTHTGRDDAPEGALKDWLRIGISSENSRTQFEAKPYQKAGAATVVLSRPLVEKLRDTLTTWLDRESTG